jgi:hypothetical protein
LDVPLHAHIRVNAVEGFFAKLTRRRLRRGVFRSVVDLKAAIGGEAENRIGEGLRLPSQS